MNETRGTGSFAVEFKFKKEGTSEFCTILQLLEIGIVRKPRVRVGLTVKTESSGVVRVAACLPL